MDQHTLSLAAAQVLVTTLIGIPIMSLAEHWIHRHVMHMRRFPEWVYRVAPDLEAQFRNHAVRHHGEFYDVFDQEPSEEGKYFNLRILGADVLRLMLLFSPVLLILWWLVSPLAAFTLGGLVFAHTQLWNVAHVQMHVPEKNYWFRNTAWFRLLARHHFMHHQRPGRNFNVVLPIADFMLGSKAAPRRGDVREMLRLGHLQPRTEVGRRFVGTAPRVAEDPATHAAAVHAPAAHPAE